MSWSIKTRNILIAGVLALLSGLAAPLMSRQGSPTFSESLESLRHSLETRQFAVGVLEARKLLAQIEQDQGPESEEVQQVLAVLVDLPWRGRNADKDEILAVGRRNVQLAESLYGPDDPRLATALNSLANVIRGNEGALNDSIAVPLFQRALAIREKALGPDHPDVAKSLHNLAAMYMDMGDYLAAEPLQDQAIQILEKASPKDEHALGIALQARAWRLRMLGDYEGAKALYEDLIRKATNRGEPVDQQAGDLFRLGCLLADMEDLTGARERLEAWLRMEEKVGRAQDSGMAGGLVHLGSVFNRMGESARAMSIAKLALSLHPNELDAADVEVLIAEIDAARGAFAESKKNYDRAVPVLERYLGHGHPEVARTLAKRARLQWAMGDQSGALESALKAELIARGQFTQTAHTLTEREALRYESVRATGRDMALSVIEAIPPERRRPDLVIAVWESLIRSRALVLDEIGSRHHAEMSEQEPEIVALSHALQLAGNRLSGLLARGPSGDKVEEHQAELNAMREERDRAERALAARSAAFRERIGGARAGLPEIRAALPAGTALVAYVKYARLARSAGRLDPRVSAANSTPSYAAFVLDAGRSEPVIVPLSAASRIDALVAAWRHAVSSAPEGLPITSAAAEKKYRETASALREAVWDPLAGSLRRASTVFVVPDGSLNLISLATLPIGDDGYLAQTGQTFHYLSAERDIVRHKMRAVAGGKGLLVLGGPDYDARTVDQPRNETASTTSSGGRVATGLARSIAYRGATVSCGSFRTLRFGPLPGAAKEAAEVGSILRGGPASSEEVVTLTGAGATEEAFKRLAPGRRVLHLATHGFFVQEACGTERQNGNPLLLTGLALAGANHRQEVGADASQEDGILTAEEVASLDLTGVSWAVLSGCETGSGQVFAGEGVLGLRRAFEVAGADTLIMSLWDVEDEVAHDWMTRLYQGRLAGLSTAETVRAADIGMLEEQRSLHRTTHPFFWGAFVAAGDWN